MLRSARRGPGNPEGCPGGSGRGRAGARGEGGVGAEHPSRGTVLLVEDEESIADLVRLYLERDGFRVVWRTDGRSGLAAVDAERPRLVLLDLMLPGMDGFEVTRALRERGGRMPIIVVTAREEEADRVLGLELGADDYVTKPSSAAPSRNPTPAPSRPCTWAASRSTRPATRSASKGGRCSSPPASSSCSATWSATAAWR